jgi:hydrogenase maturation protein HypF
MTSGNLSEEPIAYTNAYAKNELSNIADGFLFHNRAIETRIDDSVLTVSSNNPYFLRRSRGFAPDPIRINAHLPKILAVGAELKNTFCLTRDSYAFVSHHIGDLQNSETLDAFETSIPHYQDLFRITPQIIACDLHPDYLSTRYAIKKSQADTLPLFQVQHHHAHMASVMADNQYPAGEPVIGLCFDGTGLGSDGKIWGGEFLYGDYAQFNRFLHLEYMPLPGGDSATLNPSRIAAAYLWKCGLNWEDRITSINTITLDQREVLLQQLISNLNCPLTSSMGRLFDAVSSLIGIRHRVNYEAQAAIELEAAVYPEVIENYPVVIEENSIKIAPLLSSVINDLFYQVNIGIIATKFHNTICEIALEGAKFVKQITACNTVALSGGVWQNLYLLSLVKNRLTANGFNVLAHKLVPSNDGGISLGQAMVANAGYLK